MKIGVIGAGAVGSACLISLAAKPCIREIVLIDQAQEKAEAIAADMQYAASLCSTVQIKAGDYSDLVNAVLVIICVDNDDITQMSKNIIPPIVAMAPACNILIATESPDLLADLAHNYLANNKVLSMGTFLETVRFRFHLAKKFKVNPCSIDALVVGEQGPSSIFVWSLANIGGVPVLELLQQQGVNEDVFKQEVEREIRAANFFNINGGGDCLYSVGIAAAHIAEIILKDEQVIVPIGSYQEKYGVTLSLPSKLGWTGVSAVYEPHLSMNERCALQKSADILKQALLKLD